MKSYALPLLCFVLVCTAASCKKKDRDALPLFAAPSWKAVETTDYPYSMTAVVKLPHSMQSDSGPGDQLAAFIGEDCRGIGVPVEIRNELTFYVMIRGAASESGHVHFIYYSARNGHLYRSDNGAEFAVDGLYGTADQPVVLDLRPWKE